MRQFMFRGMFNYMGESLTIGFTTCLNAQIPV